MFNAYMERLTCWTSLMVVLVISCHFQTSDACFCSYRPPQTHFCESDFLVVVNVINLFQFKSISEVIYEVEVQHIIKASEEARIALELKPVRLQSPLDSVCGRLALTPGTTWLVNGMMVHGQLHVPFSSYNQLWSNVTTQLRKSFQQSYQLGCTCYILDSQKQHRSLIHSADGTMCLLDSRSGSRICKDRYGICMPSFDGCSWMSSDKSSDAYDKCITESQRLRVRTAGNFVRFSRVEAGILNDLM